MRLEDSKKILLDYIFSYTLAEIYKYAWMLNSENNHNVTSISEQYIWYSKYFLRSTILAIFEFLRNSMCYFDHLYIELYTLKIIKN